MPVTINGTSGVTGNTGTLISASTVGVGGATPAASGAGITFPVTQSASTSANTLDDYEEGTWTASFSSPTNMTGVTWSSGMYTKIGNLVTVQGSFACTITSSNTLTYVRVTLPFTVVGSDQTGVAFANNNIRVGVCDVSSSEIFPFFPAASAIVSGSEVIQFSATYMTT